MLQIQRMEEHEAFLASLANGHPIPIAHLNCDACRLNVSSLREHFPILARQIHDGKPLVYLDNAATTQKPVSVIEAMNQYYRESNANVHRGVHYLSEEATRLYEDAHKKVARFINAKSFRQIIFTRNTTESINLVAYTWGRSHIREGDEILLTVMEHHSNLVPWQLLTQQTGAKLRFLEIDEEGLLCMDQLHELLSERTKLVAVTHVSNVLGTVNPIHEIVEAAHAVGAKVLVDAAQSAPHLPINVQGLDCDFLAFSGHKMCGPTGIGVLYGKRDLLEEMPPFLGGGDMIRSVSFQESTWNSLPWKFEAGTPAIAEGIGLGAAIDYLTEIGMGLIFAHERELAYYTHERLDAIDGIRIYGPKPRLKGGVVTFDLCDIHPHDIAAGLDQEGIAIRAGHHCAQPLMQILGTRATARASFYFYNTLEDVDVLADALEKVKKFFRR